MSSKEAALSKLLSAGTGGSVLRAGSLIQEVGGTDLSSSSATSKSSAPDLQQIRSEVDNQPKAPPQEDQPSLLEMMMAAQREALVAKEVEKKTEAAVDAKKGLGGGFKKGFFGGSAKTKPSSSQTTLSTNGAASSGIVEVKKTAASQAKSDPFVVDDVQRAMEEDKHPLLKQLKQNGMCALD
jgi:hypothetical protein